MIAGVVFRGTAVVVVLTLTCRHSSAVHDHGTGSNDSGVEAYLRRKTKDVKAEDNTHK